MQSVHLLLKLSQRGSFCCLSRLSMTTWKRHMSFVATHCLRSHGEQDGGNSISIAQRHKYTGLAAGRVASGDITTMYMNLEFVLREPEKRTPQCNHIPGVKGWELHEAYHRHHSQYALYLCLLSRGIMLDDVSSSKLNSQKAMKKLEPSSHTNLNDALLFMRFSLQNVLCRLVYEIKGTSLLYLHKLLQQILVACFH